MIQAEPVNEVDSGFFENSSNLFKIVGLWRIDSHPWWLEPYIYISRFLMFTVFGALFISWTLSGSYLYYQDGDMDNLFTWTTFAFAFTVMHCKFFLLVNKEEKLKDLIKTAEEFSSRYPDKTNVHKALRTYKKILMLGAFAIGGAVVFYVSTPLLFGIFGNVRNLPLKTMFTFGFDVYKNPYYEIYSIYEIVASFVNNIVAVYYDVLFVGILFMVSAILKNLNAELRKNLLETNISSEERYNLLIDRIKDRQEILKYINDISELFMTSNLLHFIYNYFTAGVTMFQVSRLPFGGAAFWGLLMGFSSQIFSLVTYCESGQTVTNEMEEFSMILYSSDWYIESIKFKKAMYLTLLGTQKNYYVSAGKLMTLSRETEKKILNAIFTYYTFLHRVK